MICATVTIRAHDPDTGAECYEDWGHEDDVELGELGLWIRDIYSRTFIPWSSVVRVDYEPCRCAECRPKRAA